MGGAVGIAWETTLDLRRTEGLLAWEQARQYGYGAEAFAARAQRAIAAGDSYRVIPWQMAWVARLLRVLPNAWFDAAFAGRGRKRRRGE